MLFIDGLDALLQLANFQVLARSAVVQDAKSLLLQKPRYVYVDYATTEGRVRFPTYRGKIFNDRKYLLITLDL